MGIYGNVKRKRVISDSCGRTCYQWQAWEIHKIHEKISALWLVPAIVAQGFADTVRALCQYELCAAITEQLISFSRFFNKQYISFKKMTRAALIIQSQYRTYREHERFKKSRRAAAIIQNSFRSYRERRRSSHRRREERLSKRQEARYMQKASNR